MITSQQSSLLYELRQKPIPEATLIELEARLQHRIHAMILDAFNESGLSQLELAERLGWDPARVSRCLGASSNWTLKTINSLMAAIGVDLDDPSYTSFEELERRLKGETSITVLAENSAAKTLSSEKTESLADMTGSVPSNQRKQSNVVHINAKQRPRRSLASTFLGQGEAA